MATETAGGSPRQSAFVMEKFAMICRAERLLQMRRAILSDRQ
jgi:hypothetical protein